MTKQEAQELAEQCGFTWLTTKDYGEQLHAFALKVQNFHNETNEIDFTGNPAHVLASLAQARGEPINDRMVQRLAELCGEDVQAPEFLVFVDALAQLCIAHGVTLSASGYDELQVWDADARSGPIYCPGIQNRMINKNTG